MLAEPLSPELALVDPELRRRAIAFEVEVRYEPRRLEPAAAPAAVVRTPASASPRVSVAGVLVYAAVRLLEVLAFGALAALVLLALVVVAVVY